MNVAIIVPMLTRAHRVEPLLASIRATCDATVVFACSPSDDEVLAAVEGERYVIVDGPHPGDYARKINRAFRACSEELVFLGACDLEFHAGWLEAAVAQLGPGVGVVGTNDLGSPRVMNGEHATHSLVTREYVRRFGTIDQPGAVLCEEYPHEYVDDEFVATAKHRSAWAFAADSIVEHLHPSWGKAPMDAMYAQQSARMKAGRKIYRRRQRLWT